MFLLIAVALTMSGCSIKGRRYYPAVGIGMTSVSTNAPGTVHTETVIVGFGVVAQPSIRCIFGFGRVSTTQFQTNTFF